MILAKKGFTLIELLVVIAIIGILAAIILPVYAQAKRSAYRSADMSNMNQLRTAMQLYKVDQGAYPPALLGYVTLYASGPNEGNIIPANLLQGALFPKRVSSITTFTPALDRGSAGNFNLQTVSPAFWPSGAVGNVSVGECATGSPVGCNLQRFGPTQPVQNCQNGELTNLAYYAISGYDVAQVTATGGGTREEIHYSPFWTGYTVQDQCTTPEPGSASDNPAQLGYSDPPETTVVTWDSYFRNYDSNGNPEHQRQDIVLYLGGDARPHDSADVAANAWAVGP
jgi:type II secretion system protein G